MSTSSLVSSIKARVQSVLGVNYSEIGYALDLTKNTFKGNQKSFGVLPKDKNEVPGVIGHLTQDQDFEITITDSYINQQLSDSLAQSAAITLQDLTTSIYKDLVNSKCGSALCLTVQDLRVSEPQIPQENVMAVVMTIKVKYRQQL